MSDLHGEYNKYQKMLELINFSKEDTLIINGDICDRGSESAKIYLDVMQRENVIVIKGNHELMAQDYLERIFSEYPDNKVNIFELYKRVDLYNWFDNGGLTTMISFFDEDPQTRAKILEFIKNLPVYIELDVNEKHYVIVHGGLGDYKEFTSLDDVSEFEMLWSRPDFNKRYFEDENTFVIVGHTPTLNFCKNGEPAKIYHGAGGIIDIDCGASYLDFDGRLGCLCLNTGEEFYV